MEPRMKDRGCFLSFLSILLISVFCFGASSFGALTVEPADDYTVSGPEGGPFAPNEKTYTLTNTGDSAIYWGADESASWLDCSPEWGALDPNEAVSVTVSINTAAESFSAGQYTEDVTFTDITNNIDNIRSVFLTVTSDLGGPLAWWKLDGDATDSSGNTHDGTVYGDPNWITEGKIDGAIELNGEDDYVETPFILNPADGPFSAFAWVKGGSEYEKIICQTDGSGTGRNWLHLEAEIYCGYPEGALTTNISGPDNWNPLCASIPWEPDEWHHVGVTWDGHRRRLYIDAIEVAADTEELSGLEYCDGGLYIGTHKSLETDKFLGGLIDDVRIYGCALSQAEIAELAGIGPLIMSPNESFDASGEPGGPFTPGYKDYTIKNLGDQTLYWGIDTLPNWVDVDKSFGALDPNENTTVRAFLTEDADTLGEGLYSTSVVVNNLSVTQDPIIRDVNLDIQLIHGIWVEPESFDLTLIEGTQQQDTLTIGNDSSTETYNFSLRTRTVSGSAATMMVETNSVAAPQKMIFDTEQAIVADYKPGQVLVRFAQDTGSSIQSMMLQQAKVADTLPDGIILSRYESVPGLCLVELPEGVGVADALESFNARDDVLYVQPNYRVYANETLPNDLQFSNLWGMHNTGQSGGTQDADIDAPEAWSIATGSDSVIVAVIDTGVDYNHEDLAANMWINEPEYYGSGGVDDDGNGYVDDIYGYDFCNYDPNPMDDHYHGTHCAGTIGAVGNNGKGVTGVCWDVRIMAVKFLDSGGGGWTDDAIKCVEYATMMGADVMSNSWGGGAYSQGLKDAIDAAGAAGIAFVAAAGNDSVNNDVYPQYPSSYTSGNVIAVAATDRYDNKSSFSNYGPTSVDLGAPGSSILSCEPGNQYQYLNGTSMAAPHVAGACAMLRSINPMLSVTEMKDILLNTVDPISALNGKCVSGGRLNLNNAVLETSTPWISFNLEQGQLGPEESMDIQVTFDATALVPGQYYAEIIVVSDDPTHPQITIPVSMTVLPDPLEVSPDIAFDPNGLEGGPFEPNSIVYSLHNVGSQALEWAAEWQVDWLTVVPDSGILDPNQTADVFVSLNGNAMLLDPNQYEEMLLFHNLNLGSIQQRSVTLKVRPPDKFTEVFEDSDFDLGYRAILIRPDSTVSGYASCMESESIGDFPVDPSTGIYLSLGDDDFVEIPFTLSGEKQIKFYGQYYDRIFIGSNGYLTFGQGDMAYTASLDNHFRLPRIAPLFTDLTPANDECISYLQTDDRVVVTYNQVPIYGDKTRVNSFQIEIFFADGAIRLSYLNIDADQMIVGLSDGNGNPKFFEESNFSAYLECCACGDTDGDSSVGFSDLCDFALAWMSGDCVGPNWCGWNDYNRSGRVDLGDFSSLSANWQLAKYEWSEPQELLELNGWIWTEPESLSELNDGQGNKARSPALSRDLLTIIYNRYVPELGYNCIFEATRTSVDESFSNERRLDELIQIGGYLGGSWLTADGLRLYYNESYDDTEETYIKTAVRSSTGDPWTYERTLEEIHYGAGYKETASSLTDDELTIFFTSTRPDGVGASTIWTASRESKEVPFSNVYQLTELVEPAVIEDASAPFALPDGLTLYFHGMDAEDANPAIYKVTRSSLAEPFANHEKLTFPGYDTTWELQPCVTPDGKTLFYQNGSAIDHAGIWVTTFGPDPLSPYGINPFFCSDGLTLYTGRLEGAISPCIVEYQRADENSAFEEVRVLEELGQVNAPWVSTDGLRMYYHTQSAEIWMASRDDVTQSWTPVSELSELGGYYLPSLTEDELVIVWQRYSAPGEHYLLTASRSSIDEPFSNIRELDELKISTSQNGPFLMPDGLTIYFAANTENEDEYLLYKATRSSREEPFGEVQKIGSGILGRNLFVAPDEQTIYFYKELSEMRGIWEIDWGKREKPCLPR